ncbi:helix-turn-helix domain-containing protein [Pseudomonas sp. Irchel 3E20]|uniref:helix-turn-helix domain-containing protein n=1 Tax=Pseudomonas sp. Irchel 3E20 TaxID=2008983 RepID=UPI000BA2DE77|nr:helix-turn-helix transcriptional regulator [Pseudomonas sp. Irchel 3E20]
MKERTVAHRVGATIAFRRKAKGLTQAYMAEAIGVEKETISRMENGVISISLTRLQQMSEVLECSLSDLVRASANDAHSHSQSVNELIQSLPTEERVIVVNLVTEVVKVLKAKGPSQPS